MLNVNNIVVLIILIFIISIIYQYYYCFNNIEYYVDYTYDQLDTESKQLYDSRVTIVPNHEDFTLKELVDKDITWLTKSDVLDESQIFGLNQHSEPIRFVEVFSSVNYKTYVAPEFYRINRWCRVNSDCPHKPKPYTDLSGNFPTWDELVDASDVSLNQIFKNTYGHLENYSVLEDAFQYHVNTFFKYEYGTNNTTNTSNTTNNYSEYLREIEDLDKMDIYNDPKALSWIESDIMDPSNNTTELYKYFKSLTLGDTNQYPPCSTMSLSSNYDLDNYGENPNGFIFNNTPIVNATPYPFTNPSVGGSCGNLDVNGDKTKVCFFK